jgi:hypothetical protein
MFKQTQRTRIADLATVGEELATEHLRLVAGAAGKKTASYGTCSVGNTYIWGPGGSGGSCQTDSDID